MTASKVSLYSNIPYKNGMKIAKYFKLEKEFKDAYIKYINSGDDPQQAVWCALYDWDMLE